MPTATPPILCVHCGLLIEQDWTSGRWHHLDSDDFDCDPDLVT